MARSSSTDLKEGDVALAAEVSLQFDDDNLRAIAEVYKNEGNDEYSKENFHSAINFYTKGIKVNCKDEQLNVKLYSNRAAAHFNLGNYTETLCDAKTSIGLQPSFLKAFVRGASACVELKKFDEAITLCEKGLAIDESNQELLELQNRSLREQRKLLESHGEKKTCTKAATYTAENPYSNSATLRDISGIRKVHCNPVNVFDSLGDFKIAIDYLDFYLKISKQLGDRPEEGKAYGNLGIAYHNLGDFKKAIGYHERALKIAKELGDRSEEGKVYGSLGTAHDSLGDFKTAIGYHESYVNIVKESGDRSEEEKVYGNLGIAHYKLGDFKRAIDYFERYLKLAKELNDQSREGKGYCCLGNAHYNLGNVKTAIDYFERSLTITKDLGDKEGEGKASGNLGTAHCSLGHIRTAITFHEREMNIARELGDRLGEGIAYNNLGNAYYNLGSFKTAKNYHEQQLKIAIELPDKSGEGRAYSSLGNVHHSLGDIKTAMEYHKIHLKLAKELRDRSGEGVAYGNLGITYYSLGEFKTAIEYHERALKIAKEWADRFGEGRAYANLGNANYSLGRFETAKDYYECSLKMAKEMGNKPGEGKAYGNLGVTHHSLGEYKTAIENQERCLKISKELGDRFGEGKAYGNLGNAYYSLGEFKTALDYYEHDLKIAKELGDGLGEGMAYGNLGSTYYILGDFQTALDYYEHDLEISKQYGDRSGEKRAHGNLGLVYNSLGDYRKAIDHYERSLKIAKELDDRLGESKAYGNLGNTHRKLGNLKTALEYNERSLKIAKESSDPSWEGLSHYNLGLCFELLGQVEKAITHYKLTVSFLNHLRDRLRLNDDWKISLRDRYQTIYAALWRLLLAEGKATEALVSAEQGRAQGLEDLLTLNYGFEVRFAKSDKENSSFHEPISGIPPNTIFMAMTKQCLIFWVFQTQSKFALRSKPVIFQDDINTFFQSLVKKIGPSDDVQCEDRSLELARDKSLVAKRSPQDDRQTQQLDLQKSALSTLYDTIIEPIQDLLLGSELIFVPEGPLCLAPFAAFKGPDSKYLCESFKIRVAPSLTSLKMIADCPLDYHHNTGAVLVGDPLTELPPLPCAREEVEMIGKMLSSTPLIGTQATKDEVLRRLGSAALVHMAAHGNMETGDIALASNEGVKKDILTMRDVLGVQMRARLVVLSCCHSARGEIKAEGVVGIARAFLGAGARSVLVSLWAIDDEATLELMKNFYQNVVKGRSASEALNQAMNCMRESEEFSAVKFWAPFVLIGDDVKLEFSEST